MEKRKEALLAACAAISLSIADNKLSNRKVIDAIDSYHADRHQLASLDRKLKLRQHKMCRQLLHIFPLPRALAVPGRQAQQQQHAQPVHEQLRDPHHASGVAHRPAAGDGERGATECGASRGSPRRRW